MTPAGKKNRRIIIQRKTVTADADGYKIESWATHKITYGMGAEHDRQRIFITRRKSAV